MRGTLVQRRLRPAAPVSSQGTARWSVAPAGQRVQHPLTTGRATNQRPINVVWPGQRTSTGPRQPWPKGLAGLSRVALGWPVTASVCFRARWRDAARDAAPPARQVGRVDAVAAALAAVSGEASGRPKVMRAAESIRVPRVARRGAVKARTQAASQLRDFILTAPRPATGPVRQADRETC